MGTIFDLLNLDVLTSDPASPTEGSLWYNSTLQALRARLAGSTISLAPVSPTLVQTADAKITANTSTTSTAFVDALTIDITTDDSNLMIWAQGAIANGTASRNMQVRITVDGVSTGGIQLRSLAANVGQPFSLAARVPVTAGAHVVKLQWLTQAGTTLYCRPVLNVDRENVSMLVQEVGV